jgi:ribosomal protein L31
MKKVILYSASALLVFGCIATVAVNKDEVFASSNESQIVKKGKVNALLVSNDKKEVQSVNDKAAEGLAVIQQNAPFHVRVPDKLTTDHMKASMMTKSVKESDGSTENIDLVYTTANGRFHIWQTNHPLFAGKDPVRDSQDKEKVDIDGHHWSYMKHEDGSHIFNARFGDVTISVDGTLPYDEMIEVIKSLK